MGRCSKAAERPTMSNNTTMVDIKAMIYLLLNCWYRTAHRRWTTVLTLESHFTSCWVSKMLVLIFVQDSRVTPLTGQSATQMAWDFGRVGIKNVPGIWYYHLMENPKSRVESAELSPVGTSGKGLKVELH